MLSFSPYHIFQGSKGVCSDTEYPHFFCLSFTGKELDAETGYSYFGARYYDPAVLTAWLSVDPMADKYPSISPYAYCAWNPLKLVDPDGDTIAFSGTYEEQVKLKGLMAHYKQAHPNQYKKLNQSSNIYNIQYTSDGGEDHGGNFSFNPGTGFFDINIREDRRQDYSDIEVLAHEMKHADQYEDGKLGFLVKYDRGNPTKVLSVNPIAYDIMDEIEAAKQADGMLLVPEGSLAIELQTRTKYSNLPKEGTDVSQYLQNFGIDINKPNTYNTPLQRIIHNVKTK